MIQADFCRNAEKVFAEFRRGSVYPEVLKGTQIFAEMMKRFPQINADRGRAYYCRCNNMTLTDVEL